MRGRVGVLLALILGGSVFGSGAAIAESDSARVETAALTCANWVTSGSTNIPLDCALATAAVPIVPVGRAEDEVWQQVEIAQRRQQTTKVGDRLVAVVGEVFSQLQRLTGLRATFDADITDVRVAAGAKYGSTSVYYNVPLGGQLKCTIERLSPCLAVLASAQDKSYNDSVSKFVWNNNAKLYADPDTSECKCADGQAIWTVYTSQSQPRPEFEFFATSQKSSVTPVSGWKMKEVSTYIRPDPERRDLEVADFDPNFADDYGSGGSFSLGASLSGEFGAGYSFSIGRTWNFPKGYAGGGLLHNDEHYTIWRTAGSGDPYARGTAGVETWKEPAGARALWEIGGYYFAGK